MKRFCVALLSLSVTLHSALPVTMAQASSPELQQAEQAFWSAAKKTGNIGIISAYLLHFANGRFVEMASSLYQAKTGVSWNDETADTTAWRNPSNDNLITQSDETLSGRWTHLAKCDVNFFVQDVSVQSTQNFNVSSLGILNGDSSFRSGDSFEGRGKILELRRDKSVLTYVMTAENNLTGNEVHIGILNLSQTDGKFVSRGWEMNTGGAYCDVNGEKID